MKGRYLVKIEDQLDEGFQHIQPQTQELIVHQHYQQKQDFNTFAINRRKNKNYSSEKPHFKINALAELHKNQTSFSTHHNHSTSLNNRNDNLGEHSIEMSQLITKKNRQLGRNRSIVKMEQEIENVIYKTKRAVIGEDLEIISNTDQQDICIKEVIKQNPLSTLVYRQYLPNSTHSYFRKLMHETDHNFISSKYNNILRQKISRVKGKVEDEVKNKHDIEFRGDFQSGNMDFAIKMSQSEYNVFLKIDTHTRGHQGWFYFLVKNHAPTSKRITINICNIKRKFKMIKFGQKIFFKLAKNDDWNTLNEQIQMSIVNRRIFKLSFQITLQSKSQTFLSLIPPYTYTQLLKDIQHYQKLSDVKVEILTHSISGLAIPLLNITKGAKNIQKNKDYYKKKLFLISGRIHPSETCSSYIINGLIRQLLSGNEEMEQFLKHSIVKIIPMLNPDGVVFGNFRTNYLGDDLNRSFNHNDDSIYPEVVAIKQLGKILKNQFKDNFIAFIDLHGHSCQSNSFVYGPEYDKQSEEFVECRVLPKILDRVSKYFSYSLSSFKLEEYKQNTARGFFLKKLRVPSYTIQTSYALFKEKGEEQQIYNKMSMAQWSEFGLQLINSVSMYLKYLQMMRKNSTQQVFKKIKDNSYMNDKDKDKDREIRSNIKNVENKHCKQQIKFGRQFFINMKKQIQFQVDKQPCISKMEGDTDSDGQSAEEDLQIKQKEKIIKKIKQTTYPTILFPKVLKPAMILPSVIPSIIIIGRRQYKELNNMPRLATKIKQKKLARPFNLGQQYTEYLLKNINNINSLRPEIINFNNLRKKVNDKNQQSLL